MSRKLEDLINIPPIAEMQSAIDKTEELSEAIDASGVNFTLNEKLEAALPIVADIMAHDSEMDDIARKAIDSYNELCDMADNTPAMYSGKIYEVAANMLRTAMDAREAKLQKKLRIVEMQLKKLRIDKVKDESGDSPSSPNNSNVFDRNELLELLKPKKD